AQIRQVVGVLRQPPGERDPARPQLAGLPELVAAVRTPTMDSAFRACGQPEAVTDQVAATAYRIVQEALTNTVKHAGATAVDTCLTWTPGALRIDVVDNGRAGPPGPADRVPDRPPGAGHGLAGMRERIEACGGTFSAGPLPGGGFAVTATLPALATGAHPAIPGRGDHG
ncbi:MAG: sensor histidine kinase, partial [Dactylosporangium sp.]|nr:hypothetical protein [Dactylosporangium sp.]NNJ63281.1 sensor histidine kinase [Dactylosporangium sp.]